MTAAQALATAVALRLDRLDSQLLLLLALGRPQADRAWLLTHDGDDISPDAARAYQQFCGRRSAGEPLAYIVGHKEFFGLELRVDSRVLVPRPDTETLVEWALDILGGYPGRDQASRPPAVIDLGTGSGAVALAIKKARPDANVEAVDSSPGALEVAAANAQSLGLDVALRLNCWLTGTSSSYDMIVSNPPYVCSQDPHLAALAHEPLSALAAGPDGLVDIHTIVAQAPARLKPGGWLLLEHGWDQAETVRSMLRAAGLDRVASRRDLAGMERCSGGQRLELG